MKKVTVLGSTGSVGCSTVEVLLSSLEDIKVVALTAFRNVKLLAKQAKRLEAELAVIGDPSLYDELKTLLKGTGVDVACGEQAIIDAAALQADWVMASIVGMAGLKPIMKALCHGGIVAIANKEPLVAAGHLITETMHRNKARILPVDSEHNAIFQVFEENNRDAIVRVILTASGGPFRTWSMIDMSGATPDQAIAHPNWVMGKKISVDSATMMNKALEVIEAHHLFNLPAGKIEIIIHPESIIHSMVEYSDGSILAQLGAADMKTPISYALAWPSRMKTPGRRLDLDMMGKLTFETPDAARFPAISLAYQALDAGPYACVALNTANEVAVEAFLNKKIGFTYIAGITDNVLQKTESCDLKSIDDVIRLDNKVRKLAEACINKKAA